MTHIGNSEKTIIEYIEKGDVQQQGVSILLYGESGAGKTSLLGTLPGDTLIIDVDGGMLPLRGNNSVYRVPITDDLANLKPVFDGLVTADVKAEFSCVALDCASELEKRILTLLSLKTKNGAPGMGDHQTAQYKMRDYARKLRDLREKGVHVVMTAWEMPLEIQKDEGEVQSRLYPMMSRRLAPELCGIFDVVARVEISTKPGHEGERFLRLDGDEKVMAKNRYGNGRFCPANLAHFIAACLNNTSCEAAVEKEGE
jgi:phage nucleotide-binding protein